MKERARESSVDCSITRSKKRTLLEKYEIPVEHLDFTYVKNCTNVKEVERILKVLRCGEEGYFPDLENCVTKRLEELDPKSRQLRVQVSILHSTSLAKDELEDLKKDFLNWVDDIEEANEKESQFKSNELSKKIFDQDIEMPDIPIRGSLSVVKDNDKLTSKKDSERIKSWEYDKWDKFDVDRELTKLDIESMQCDEWEKSLDKKKLAEEQELVAKLMKNEDISSHHGNDKKKKTIFSNVQVKPGRHPPIPVKTTDEDDDVPELEDNSPDNLTSLLHNPPTTIINSTPSTSTGKNTRLDVGSDALILKLLTSCTKEPPPNTSSRAGPSKQQFCRDPQKKSFIEEIPEVDKTKEKPKRRFKIHIDDINIA